MADARAGTQVGRSAMLVHAMSWLCAGIGLGMFFFLNTRSTEVLTALGVPFAATLAFYGWSMLLAIRAIRSNERAIWPALVIVSGLLEIAAGFVVAMPLRNFDFPPIRYMSSFGLPVFVPSFIVGALIAAPIARWRTRRAEVAAVENGGEAWNQSHRRKFALRWYVPVALLAMAVLIPAPLFVYALFNDQAAYQYPRSSPKTWYTWVVEHTPVFIAEPSAAILSGLKTRPFPEIYALSLASGRISHSRLITELNTGNPWLQTRALIGLEKVDTETALAHAEKWSQNTIAPGNSYTDLIASGVLARRGDAVRIRKMLSVIETAKATTYFNTIFLRELLQSQRFEFIPDCVRLIEMNSPYRQELLESLAQYGPSKDTEEIWLRLLEDPVRTRVREAASAIRRFSDGEAKKRLLLAGFHHRNAGCRASTLECFYRMIIAQGLNMDQPPEIVKHVIKMMDDEDLEVRRWATKGMQCFLRKPLTSNPRSTSPEDGNEITARKSVRGDAEIWLRENP